MLRSSVGNNKLIHVHCAIKKLLLLRGRLKIIKGVVGVQKVITFSLVQGAKLVIPVLGLPSQHRIRANGL